MVRDPVAFLFDKPLSNLDAQLRSQMRLEIKDLHRRLGTTIVYVTHDQIEAMTMADKIVVMRDGEILQVGTPTDLYENPTDVFTARFIGSPSMNMLPATISAGVLTVEGAQTAGLTLPAHDGGVLVGLRPHDLIVVTEAAPAGFTATGAVAAVEPLGSETLVHVQIGSSQVIATAPGRVVPAIGSTVMLHAQPGSLYLFDSASEKALGHA